MPPSRYPPALWRPVVNTSGTMVQPTRGLIPHVQQGNGSLYAMFNNAGSQVSSHLWLSKGGLVEQYVDFSQKAWAEAAGNPYWISIECEGFDTENYTPAQIAALATLYAWGMANFGWPAQTTDDPNGRGLGTHRMGGAAWGGHSCPGDIRANRRGDILAAASTLHGQAGDLVLDQATANQIYDLALTATQAALNTGTGAGQGSWAATEKAILSLEQTLVNTTNAILAGLGWNKGDLSLAARSDAMASELGAIADYLSATGEVVVSLNTIGQQLAAVLGAIKALPVSTAGGADLAPVITRLDALAGALTGLTLRVVPSAG